MKIGLAFWNVLAMMAPWLLVGFFLAGVVSLLLPRKWVVGVMGRARGWRGVLNAVLIGVPLPVCSCGVLPLTAGLRKSGAGKGAVAGFLISTPQTGIDSILATYALMGPVFAVARPLAAFVTGLAGGAAVDVLTRGEPDVAEAEKPKKEGHCCCCHCHEHAEPSEAAHSDKANPLVQIFRTGYGELLGEVARPLAVGLVVAAVVTAFVPANFFATAFGGNDWLAMPAMVLIGFPMYVCSSASIPIAASLVAKGLTPGAAFVFLMVGPAINAASMTAVAKMIGIRASVVYALVIALGAVLCGIVINLLPMDVLPQVAADAATETLALWEHLSAALLVVLVAYGLIKGRAPDAVDVHPPCLRAK